MNQTQLRYEKNRVKIIVSNAKKCKHTNIIVSYDNVSAFVNLCS